MNSTLECRALGKVYRGNVAALQNINLTLWPGRIVGLLGPNGSGKTTFIKLVAGLLTPTSGEVLVGGLHLGPETKARISYMPDKTYLPRWMSAEEAIRYYADFYPDFSAERARDMLARLNIAPAMRLKTMSKGTLEKVQLVLVMSRNADLFLLDEPIGGVDPASRDYIMHTILSNYQPTATVLISTHLIYDIEQVLDEVIFINGGMLGLHDSVDNIRTQHGKTVDGLFREVYRC